MLIIEQAEELESVAGVVSGIEYDDLVFAGGVVFLVTVQQAAHSHIREDFANAVQEDIGTDVAIVLNDVVKYQVV